MRRWYSIVRKPEINFCFQHGYKVDTSQNLSSNTHVTIGTNYRTIWVTDEVSVFTVKRLSFRTISLSPLCFMKICILRLPKKSILWEKHEILHLELWKNSVPSIFRHLYNPLLISGIFFYDFFVIWRLNIYSWFCVVSFKK